MPSARGLRADGLTNGRVFSWEPASSAGGSSAQDAEAIRGLRATVRAERRDEEVENDDHPDDGSEDEEATHLANCLSGHD